LINDAPRLGERLRINATPAQFDGLAQRPKMINKINGGILAAEQPETSAGHYRSSSRG
jgi:hypothetical protein